MQHPIARLPVRWLLVAAATVVVLATADWLIVDCHVSQPVYVTVSASVGGLFALGAMRDPWFFLAIAVALWVVLPAVSDCSAHDMFVGCYQLGWAIGAIAGKLLRSLGKGVVPTIAPPPAPE
jgi:hypothetical protein